MPRSTHLTRPFGLRLPSDLREWVQAESVRNGSSQNSEVVRAVRERMERVEAHRVQVSAAIGGRLDQLDPG